ncbi:MAG: hypothetical protein V8S08_05655 [Lachnoclostridium sp.]
MGGERRYHSPGSAPLPGSYLEGMFTHFAKADETDKTFTRQADGKYLWMKKAIGGKGRYFPYYHCLQQRGDY